MAAPLVASDRRESIARQQFTTRSLAPEHHITENPNQGLANHDTKRHHRPVIAR